MEDNWRGENEDSRMEGRRGGKMRIGGWRVGGEGKRKKE